MTAGAGLSIDRTVAPQRRPLGHDSWVELVTGFVRDPDAELARIRPTTAWQATEVLRYDRYVPEKRLSAGLRADGDPLLRQTELHLESRYRVRWSGVAAILYRDGDDFQGLHGDRELRWLDDTLIAIMVLGARRPFVFRPRRPGPQVPDGIPAGDGPDDIVLTPGRGGLLVMGGACQRDWLHGVPPDPTRDERISLTWRWSSRQGRPDTNPTFRDGRQFGDGPRRPRYRTRPS
ncbi:MAG: alpha-ketoglutarate-dependent dioxygenase AlkB [Acidimicrobiales bacterium]